MQLVERSIIAERSRRARLESIDVPFSVVREVLGRVEHHCLWEKLAFRFAASPRGEADFASSLYPRVARRRLRIEAEMAFLHNRPQGLMMPTGLG